MSKIFNVLLLSAFYFYWHGLSVVGAWEGTNVKTVKAHEFPFSVALVDLTAGPHVGGQYFCGGTLVTKEHVLTTVHCIRGKIMTFVRVLTGSSKLDSHKMKYHAIHGFITYDEWASHRGLSNSKRDLTVLTLLEPTTSDQIPLSPMRAEYLNGLRVGMASWGLSVNDLVPNYIEKAYASILPTDECLRRTAAYGLEVQYAIARYELICSAADPQVLGTCGNSGSPVFDRYTKELVGVHRGVCTQTLLGDEVNVMITIDSCRDFIQDAIKK